MTETALVVFSNEEFGKVRGLMFNGIPYFAGKDITEALEYQDTDKAIREHVDDDDKVLFKPADLAGLEYEKFTDMFSQAGYNWRFVPADIPNRGMYFINESGLYSLILSSKLPKAKEFRHWVTSEVLPSIRKTGSYSNKPAQVQEKLFRFLAGTSHITDPESQRMLTSVFVSTLHEVPQEVPELVRSQNPRAKDPDIETITMQELFDNYVVPLDIKSIPDSPGKPTLTALYNFVHTYHPEALPKVVSPSHTSKRRNRLVDRRRIDIIINDLKNYIK